MQTYLRKSITLSVQFAHENAVIQTLEGPVACAEGDAIVTGVREEHWPIQRSRFMATYQHASDKNLMGRDGLYQRKSISVQARRLETAEALTLGNNRGSLAGRPGDWLVQSEEGDFWIVADGIFQETYEPLKKN